MKSGSFSFVLEASAHLVHGQVDAGVRDDPQHVRDVAFIKRPESLPPEDLLGAVRDAGVLAAPPQRQTSFQNLEADKDVLLRTLKCLSHAYP